MIEDREGGREISNARTLTGGGRLQNCKCNPRLSQVLRIKNLIKLRKNF